jgi:hypothetical protein
MYKPVFDFDAQDTGSMVDSKHHMMLGMCYLWAPNCDRGKGDAIGRTFDAYYVYRDKRFIEAIKKCWVKVPTKNGYYWQGYRYPSYASGEEKEPVGLSRDHTLYTVLSFMESGMSDKDLKEFVTHIPWKISKSFSQTIDLWLWMRAQSGIWWAKILTPIVSIPVLSISVLINKFIYKFAPFEEEMHQDEFYTIDNSAKDPKWDKWSKFLFPSYAMAQTAWQLSYAKPGLYKSVMSWLLLQITPKHNYVMRLLLNDKNVPTKEQVYGFKPMMGGRWTGILNPYINDRDLHIMTKEQYPNLDTLTRANNLEVDIVRVVYENKINKK